MFFGPVYLRLNEPGAILLVLSLLLLSLLRSIHLTLIWERIGLCVFLGLAATGIVRYFFKSAS